MSFGTFTTNIPVEILSRIFEYLPHDSNLIQVMLVCQLFKDIIEPILYRSITIRTRYLPRTSIVDTSDPSPLMILLNTLSSRRQLAHRVTALSLGELSERDNANLARLLGLLPCVQDVSLAPISADLDLTCLRLKYLRLVIPNDAFDPEPKQVVEIMARHLWMPTLRTLQVDFFTWEDQSSHIFPLERNRTSPIIDLRLHVEFGQYHTYSILPRLLLSIKSLKRFIIQFSSWIDVIVDEMHEDLSLDVITSALIPHAYTLEDIAIASEMEFLDIHRTLPEYYLTNFTALKRLAIPESFLHYCRESKTQLALPSELEELQLQHSEMYHMRFRDMDRHYERLHALARMKESSLPALKLVVWWIQVSFQEFEDLEPWPDPEMRPEMESLLITFQNVGVIFKWVEQTDFKDTPLGQKLGYSK